MPVTATEKIALPLPILNEIARGILSDANGATSVNLTEQQVNELMGGAVKALLDSPLPKQFGVSAKVTTAFRIEKIQGQELGNFVGNIFIEKPIKAAISAKCVLRNAKTEGQIELAKPVEIIETPQGNFIEKGAASIALGQINLRRLAAEQFEDPNKLLFDVLRTEMKSRGIVLSSMAVSFKEGKFASTLKGQKVSSPR